MYDIVDLRIHYGGNFVRDPRLMYINGEVKEVTVDADMICVPHLMKFIAHNRYGKIESLSYKLSIESIEKIRSFFNDIHTLELITLARKYKKVDIFVEHGVDEADVVPYSELVPELPEPYSELVHELPELDGGIVTQPEEIEDHNEVEDHNDEEEYEEQHGGVDARRKNSVKKPTLDDVEVESVYYDSDNPPSYQFEIEEEEAQLQPQQPSKGKGNCKHPSYNPTTECHELELGMLYEDARQFKNAMIDYAVHYKRDICYYKNEPMRVMYKCAGVETTNGKGCPFHCTASWEERYKCFQLKTLEAEHKCNQKFSLRLVSQKWIEERYEDKIRDDPCIGHVQLKNHIESELKINVSISKVTRAIRLVLKKINASFEDQFRRIRDYAQECLNSNPGSTVVLKTSRVTPESPCVFQRIYVCLKALRRGFLDGCRRIIGLDGCFLKGLLKGEILTAVGRDANNQMYPIAWAVVEIENTDSWRWFLELLKNDLGITNTYPWTIISDQQKGLTTVIQELFPDSEHRNCARHIHANWSKRHKGKVLKNHFWMCAKSTTEGQFHEQLKALERRDKEAKVNLERYPPKFWCKAYFRTIVKCDIIDNNLCEAFNGTLVKARCKPIIPMLEDIRVGAMRRVARKMKSIDTWKGRYGPFIMKKVTQNNKESIGWKVDFNGDDGYEIKKGRHQFKVKLESRTCSCRAWDLSGIPCAHAICAIFDKGRNIEDYLDPCYSKEAYQRTYAHALQPMNGELFWPKTVSEEILAPVPKKMSGRPKKKRNREENEGPPTSSQKIRLSRKGRVMRCSICRQEGHNRPKCPSGNLSGIP